MNEINFIKEHGIEKAREVVEGAPEFPVFGYCALTGSYIFKRKYATAYYHNETNSWAEEYAYELILLSDLKRLVDSVTTIEKLGGIDEARKFAGSSLYFTADRERMHKAIADYESIYGGEHV